MNEGKFTDTYCLQLMVRAYYQGVSFHEAYTTVNITVKRNEHKPQFTNGEYRKEILEYFQLGDSILQVSASDQDATDVLLYRIVDTPGESDLFFLNPTTGVLSLRKVWPGGNKKEYRVKQYLKSSVRFYCTHEIDIRGQ